MVGNPCIGRICYILYIHELQRLITHNMEYFNTTNVSERQLELFADKAKTQNNLILKTFRAFPDKEISASDILTNAILDDAPITSIRRSLNTLKRRLEIVEVGQKEGLYGRPETTYKLNRDIISKD